MNVVINIRFQSFRVILRDNTGGGSVTAPSRGIRSISETERSALYPSCVESLGSSSSLVFVDNDEGLIRRVTTEIHVLRREGGSLFEKNGNRGWREGWVGLETRVYRLLDFAELTLDLAAPVKRAGASLDDGHLLRFVASAAAHQVAAVDTDTRVVALSTMGAENAEFRVLLAERG